MFTFVNGTPPGLAFLQEAASKKQHTMIKVIAGLRYMNGLTNKYKGIV
ncbi:MAG: hypothetical protein IPI00_05685 [Flavobacteriales bacterium]|nr:hypothetical protein [Flavobacteriales bacterium]MBK6946599.1 hypothetical protein [Flavobacteriales bacterium]MBK7239664.1 hypothetical protein [Flavobacteriales bacterium]MBK7298682.1 hypothetical protein [Flavobacteriales bacterium]MBK9536650.1 hypothetical protein [Flavobacteriales bacterium]